MLQYMKKLINFGGMAKCIKFNNVKIEKHYRHIFKSDTYVIELLKELNLINKMKWNKTKMAYYSRNKGLYEFGTPISLLKYNPLTFVEKMRFGISIIKIKLIKNYKNIEKYNVQEWMRKNCGNKVYEKIWEPLLISKFGNKKDKVSMAWLWGKINLRGSSADVDGEKLGYLEGSFEVLTNKIKEKLINKNCKIKLNTNVIKVIKGDRYIVKTEKEEEEYDFVISTVSYNISLKLLEELLSKEEKKKMDDLKYTSAKTLMIYSKKQLTPFYWINIGDIEIPFGGIIEHTNMINVKNYNGTNIIYISNYMDKDDKMYKLSPEELFDEYYIHLKKVNKEFKREDILQIQCFEEDDAQPIITTNYSEKILNTQLAENKIFIANMAQIYPEDRGMNYAIKMGYEVAQKIVEMYK